MQKYYRMHWVIPLKSHSQWSTCHQGSFWFVCFFIINQVVQWCDGDRHGMYHISTWDTSEITDMNGLFDGKGKLTFDTCNISVAYCAQNIALQLTFPLTHTQKTSTMTFPNGIRVESQTCVVYSLVHHHLTNRLALGTRVGSQTWEGCSLMHYHLTNRLPLGTRVKS